MPFLVVGAAPTVKVVRTSGFGTHVHELFLGHPVSYN